MADVPVIDSESVSIESADSGTKMIVNSDGSIDVQTLDVAGNFTFNAASQSATINTQGKASIIVYSIGTWVGNIGFLASVDGSTFFNITGTASNGNTVNGFTSNSSTPILISCAGYASVRITSSAWTSGTAVVYWNVSARNNFNPFTIVRMEDFSGNGLTSQANGSQRALDVGIDVAGVQVDPRSIRALTSSDTVTVVQPTGTNLHTVIDNASIPVTGTFWPATQPVSGTVAATQSGTWTVQPGNTPNTTPWLVTTPAANLWVTGTAAAAAALTITIPAVAAQYHYINLLEIEAYSSSARTGGATPVLVTSTNLPGTPVWTFASAAAIGTTDSKVFTFFDSLRSSAVNTATTIVCPATTGVIWRVNVNYSTGV